MINKQFLYYSTKDEFLTDAGYKETPDQDLNLEIYGNIYGKSIAYIADTKEIWTHGVFYTCALDEARINEILEEKGVGEKEIEIISIPSEAIQGPTYEFTSSELYSQLDDAITNNRIIVASSTDILDGSNNSVMIVFSQAMKLGTNILLSGVMAPSINLSTIVLGIESTGSCTIVTSNINPESNTPRPNSGYGSAGTSLNYSRGDHVHPAQTSVTGNAGTATKLQTARNINLTGNVTGSASFDGSNNISINTTVGNIDASKITSGTINADRLPEIPLEKLPAGALERLVIVENQAARYQLTTSDIQEGDTVKQEDTGVMYFVVDTDNLANENGYKVYTAGAATSVAWSGVTGKPSTLEGYGISDSSVCEAIEREYGYTPLDPSLDKYPEDFTWNNGTTEGPVGVLTGGNIEAITFPAIPAASEEQSGIITTATQTFCGDKTFIGNVTVDSVCNSYEVYSTYAHLSQIENQDGNTTPIYIGSGGEHSISYDGSEYTGNAATATKVKNKLTFTGAVTGEYDGSSALTVNIPAGAVTASYDGSSATTVNIPSTSMTYSKYTYNDTSIGINGANGIKPGYVYYPSSWTTSTSEDFTINVKADSFNSNTPDAVVIVLGTKQVIFNSTTAYGRLVTQSNILTTGSVPNAYRVYAFSYLGGSGTSTRVAVNCSEYTE